VARGNFVAEPSIISKLNSLLQLIYILLILAKLVFGVPGPGLVFALGLAVLVTTVTSGVDYVDSLDLARPPHRESLMRQLPLQVRLRDFAVFETFEPGPNGAVLALLSDPAAAGPAVWVWGAEGSGKSHLLQACCAAHEGAAYLPAETSCRRAPSRWPGGGSGRWCASTTSTGWSGAGTGSWPCLRCSTACGSRGLPGGQCLGRAGGAGFPVAGPAVRAWRGAACSGSKPLSDADRVAALRRRAAHRGLELSPDAARFLLRRLPRDMRALCSWLDKLDVASLAAGKRLTVPFVKSVIEAESAHPTA
jgi:DnaA-homolog protein